MKAASTDDRFQDDKKGGPILTEGGLSSQPSYRKDGARGGHLPRRMGPGGGPKFYDTGRKSIFDRVLFLDT